MKYESLDGRTLITEIVLSGEFKSPRACPANGSTIRLVTGS